MQKIFGECRTVICVFSAPDFDLAVSALPATANGFVTFGCFNNFTKMGDSVIALWARVLHAVHNSRLFLKSMPYGEPDVVNRTLEGFRSYGIAPDRLILEPRSSSRTSHLAAYSRVDIALDPFPFPGITTSCESLWMGVPVLTKKGDRFVSHQGETIAQNAGLSDLDCAGRRRLCCEGFRLYI